MTERLVIAYIHLLFIIDLVLFGFSLALHLCHLSGMSFLRFEQVLPELSAVMGFAAFAFLKDRLAWRDQLQRSPKWMWVGTIAIVAYYILIFFLLRFGFSNEVTSLDESILGSAFSMLICAASLCILYPVLWSGYLTKTAIKQRVLHSMSAIALITMLLVGYHAGYLPLQHH